MMRTEKEFLDHLRKGFRDEALMEGFLDWLSTRPPCVQALCREFPIGDKIIIEGTPHHIIGYTEDDKLIISAFDPKDDYDKAVHERLYVCAEHCRY